VIQFISKLSHQKIDLASMVTVTNPRFELLFQDVEDPFLQDIEDIEYIEDLSRYKEECTYKSNNRQQILNFSIWVISVIIINYLLFII
jgi:hypothetical protein